MTSLPIHWLLWSWVFLALSLAISGKEFRWKGIECIRTKDGEEFFIYEYCFVKAIKRDQYEISLKAHVFQIPFDNVTARVQLMRKYNGFRPFLYNVELDLCKFLNRQPLTFEKIVFDAIVNNSNFDQRCPWKDPYIYIDRLRSVVAMMDKAPFPSGEYRLDFYFSVYGLLRTVIKVLFNVAED